MPSLYADLSGGVMSPLASLTDAYRGVTICQTNEGDNIPLWKYHWSEPILLVSMACPFPEGYKRFSKKK